MFTTVSGRNQHADAHALVKALRTTLGEGVHVRSHTDLLVRVAGAMGLPEPNSTRAWQQLALLVESSSPQYLNRYTTPNGMQTRVLLRTKGPLTEATWKTFEQQLLSTVRKHIDPKQQPIVVSRQWTARP